MAKKIIHDEIPGSTDEVVDEAPDWKMRKDMRDARNHFDWAMGELKKSVNKVSEILLDVRNQGSYRCKYETFEDFCWKEFGMTRQRAHQLLQAGTVRALLASSGDPNVKAASGLMNSGQLVELASLPQGEAEEVMQEALKSGGKLTAKKIRETADSMKAEPIRKSRTIKPACARQRAKSPPTERSSTSHPSEEVPDVTTEVLPPIAEVKYDCFECPHCKQNIRIRADEEEETEETDNSRVVGYHGNDDGIPE